MLTLLISSPKQPKNDIDIYFQLLIDDLQILYGKESNHYNAYKETFNVEEKERKILEQEIFSFLFVSFFKLEYCKHILLQHNLDVIHIEYNISLIGTSLKHIFIDKLDERDINMRIPKM